MKLGSQPDLSIVIPLLNEEDSLPNLYEKLVEVVVSLTTNYEIILVDDGSTDRSVDVIQQLRGADERVKLISFSRNFGHQAALTAGMDFASGKAVVFMDADLQHPPKIVTEMWKKWKEGFEIVYTLREHTEDVSPFKNLSSRLFYRSFRYFTGIKLDSNAADFRLLDQRVVKIFREQIRERTRFLRGLTVWVGYRSYAISYVAAKREAGVSKYRLKRMAILAIDGISSFSVAPLYAGIFIGLVFSLFGFAYAAFAIVAKLMGGATLQGWASLVILVAIIGGIQLMLIGTVGIYVGKIYDEVKQRPLYLVRKSLGFSNEV